MTNLFTQGGERKLDNNYYEDDFLEDDYLDEDFQEEDYNAKPSGARKVKRGIWYFMRTLLLITAIALICYGTFIFALRSANIYILVTEGFKLRAECILSDGANEELGEYFTASYLEKDSMLSGSIYDDYTINSFSYRLSVNGISAWPWSNSVTITVTEHMSNMVGSINEDKKTGEEGKEYPLPEWQNSRYRVYFKNERNRWYIYQVVLLDASPEDQPLLTPDMRQSPIPMVTPTPSPAPTPTIAVGTSTPTADIAPTDGVGNGE